MINQRYSRMKAGSYRKGSGQNSVQGHRQGSSQMQHTSSVLHNSTTQPDQCNSEQLTSKSIPDTGISSIVKMFAAHYTQMQHLFNNIDLQLTNL